MERPGFELPMLAKRKNSAGRKLPTRFQVIRVVLRAVRGLRYDAKDPRRREPHGARAARHDCLSCQTT
jgi:hypothetical protein